MRGWHSYLGIAQICSANFPTILPHIVIPAKGTTFFVWTSFSLMKDYPNTIFPECVSFDTLQPIQAERAVTEQTSRKRIFIIVVKNTILFSFFFLAWTTRFNCAMSYFSCYHLLSKFIRKFLCSVFAVLIQDFLSIRSFNNVLVWNQDWNDNLVL